MGLSQQLYKADRAHAGWLLSWEWTTDYFRSTSYIQIWEKLKSSQTKGFESASTTNVLLLKKVTFQAWLSGSRLAPDQHSQAPALPGPHTGHTVQLPALLFWQDVIQEDPLRPVQLLRVVDERDVLVEQRATWRDRAHCLLCHLCPEGVKHRTPNSLQCEVQESPFPYT